MRATRLLSALVPLLLSACVIDLSDDDDADDDPGSGRACGGFAGLTCAADEYCDFTFDECGIADGGGYCRARPDACPEIYAPVTGADGRIYDNACFAHAAGVDDCGAAQPR